MPASGFKFKGLERTLNRFILAPADVAGPVRGVAEGYLKDEVEFGREHFAAIQDSNEMRAHENGALREAEAPAFQCPF